MILEMIREGQAAKKWGRRDTMKSTLLRTETIEERYGT